MSAEKPICSIVIRAYNEEKHIGKLLTGIERQTVQNKEIVVVDSGSTDATLEIVKKYPVKVVEIDANEFTFGRSLNRGIEAANSQYIVIISAHCYPVYPDWLEQLLKPFDDPNVAVSYGKQRGAETNHYSEHQFFRTYFPDINLPDQCQPYTHNANAAIRKSFWNEHQYNEEITGLEDLAWSSWAKENGYSIAYISDAEIVHVHDETIKQVYNRYQREAIAMKQILPKSRFTLRNMLSMFIRKSLSDLSQAKKERVLFDEGWDILSFRLVQYLGTWQGYRYSGGIDQQLHRQFYYPPGSLTEKSSETRSVQPIRYQSTIGEE